MRPPAALALAAAFLLWTRPASAAERAGQVLAFSSQRAGTPLLEPRVAFCERHVPIDASVVLEYDVRVERSCASVAGVEIVFADGRRSAAGAVEPAHGWTHVRVPLGEFAGTETARFELVARGSLADEIAFLVDEVVLTRAGSEAVVLFHDTLDGGARVVRDDRRQSGAALVDAAVPFDQGRTVLDGTTARDPWHVYDLANLRRRGDGDVDLVGPSGNVLVGPAVPMSFARSGERAWMRSERQKLAFEPLEGGRYYTVWLALSTADGEPLTTRYFAFGDAGERRAIGLVVPGRGDVTAPAGRLGNCRLVSSTIASLVPLQGIELPDEPRLRIHAVTFQWHDDGARDRRFQLAWLRDLSATGLEIGSERAQKLRRFVEGRDLAPLFSEDALDAAGEQELFTSLLKGDLGRFDGALRAELHRREALGEALSGLRVTLEDVRGERPVVRIESGIDPESMLDAFVRQSGSGVFVLEGDPAVSRQAPQILSGLGRTAVLLPVGPRFARWSGPDGSSTYALAPFRVLSDAREFGEIPWRQWRRASAANLVSTDLLLAVDGEARRRGDAAAIAGRLAGVPGVPDVRVESAESYADEAARHLGAEFPVFAPGALTPVADADVRTVAERAPALRLASDAVSRLAILSTPAAFDGSEYPRAAVDRLLAESRALDDGDPRGDAEALRRRADELLADELAIVARGAATAGKGTPIAVFNALPWGRRGLVELDLPDAQLFGADGAPLAWQTTASGGRVFALDAPALGYEIVRGLRGGQAGAQARDDIVVVEGWSVRDGHVGFTLDPATGAITSLRLPREGIELLAAPAQLLGPEWHVVAADFVEKGPVRALARVALTRDTSRVDLEFALASGARRIEVSAVLHGEATAWRIPGRFTAPRALFGVPFGSSVAAPHDDGRAARHRIGDWAALTDGSAGIGLLAGDPATVLVETDALAPELCPGRATRFALVPFAGGWRKACLAGRARELGSPLSLIATDAHEGAREPRHSFFSIARSDGFTPPVEGPECGILMTAFRPTDDGAGANLRLAETHGVKAAVALSFDRPVFGAERLDLRDRATGVLKVEERRVLLELGPHQIATVRVRLRP